MSWNKFMLIAGLIWVFVKLPPILKLIVGIPAGIALLVWLVRLLRLGSLLAAFGMFLLSGLLFFAHLPLAALVTGAVAGSGAYARDDFKTRLKASATTGLWATLIALTSIGLLLSLFSVVPALRGAYDALAGLIPPIGGALALPLEAAGAHAILFRDDPNMAVIQLAMFSLLRLVALVFSIMRFSEWHRFAPTGRKTAGRGKKGRRKKSRRRGLGGLRAPLSLVAAFVAEGAFYSPISRWSYAFFGPILFLLFIGGAVYVGMLVAGVVAIPLGPVFELIDNFMPGPNFGSSSEPPKEEGLMDTLFKDPGATLFGGQDTTVGSFFDGNSNEPLSVIIDGSNKQAYAVDRDGHRTPVYPVGNGRYTDGNGHEIYPP